MASIDYIDVVKLAQQGDLDAFGTLVVRFQDMAYGYAYSRLGDSHLAEDVAQEAFVEGFQTIGQLRHPEAWPSWLQRLVFKHCDRIWRRKRVSTTTLDATGEVASGDMTPEDELVDQESKSQIMAALQELPKPEQTALTLFYVAITVRQMWQCFWMSRSIRLKIGCGRAEISSKKGCLR